MRHDPRAHGFQIDALSPNKVAMHDPLVRGVERDQRPDQLRGQDRIGPCGALGEEWAQRRAEERVDEVPHVALTAPADPERRARAAVIPPAAITQPRGYSTPLRLRDR
jgi:hypothetical protein